MAREFTIKQLKQINEQLAAQRIPRITTAQFLDAVCLGVREAMWQMMTNTTDTPCADFYDAIKKGVYEAASEGTLTIKTGE